MRNVTLTLAFAFGHLVRFASVSRVSRPKVSIFTPPVAILIVITFDVSAWIFLLAVTINATDLLIYVARVRIKAFTTGPIFALSIQFQICLMR